MAPEITVGSAANSPSRVNALAMRGVDVAAQRQGNSHRTCCDETRGCFGGEEQALVTFSESGHVAKYDIGRLYRFGFLFFRRGTAFDDPFIWLQLLLILAVATAIAACFALAQVPEEAARQYAERLRAIALSMQGLSAFFLGLFVSLVIGTWKEVRYGTLGRFFAAAISIAVVIGQAFPGHEARVKALRMRVMRYLLLTFSLMCMEARSDVRLPELLEAKLVTVSEVALLQSAPVKAEAVMSWLAALVLAAQNAGIGSFVDRKILLEEVCLVRGMVAEAHMYVSSQLPLPYTNLIAMVVKLTLIVETIRGGAELYVASLTDYWDALNTGLMLILFGVVYQGCLNLHLVLSNPFGYDAADFPQSKLFRDLAASVHTQLASPTLSAGLAAEITAGEEPIPMTPASNPAKMPGVFSRHRSGSERLWEAIAAQEHMARRDTEPGSDGGPAAASAGSAATAGASAAAPAPMTLQVPDAQLGWPASLQTPDSPPRRPKRRSRWSSGARSRRSSGGGSGGRGSAARE